jgi:hypothetical protein
MTALNSVGESSSSNQQSVNITYACPVSGVIGTPESPTAVPTTPTNLRVTSNSQVRLHLHGTLFLTLLNMKFIVEDHLLDQHKPHHTQAQDFHVVHNILSLLSRVILLENLIKQLSAPQQWVSNDSIYGG